MCLTLQAEAALLRRQVGEAEGEVQVLLGQLAVQSKLAIASSQELTHLHDLIHKHEDQRKLVSVAGCACPVDSSGSVHFPQHITRNFHGFSQPSTPVAGKS